MNKFAGDVCRATSLAERDDDAYGDVPAERDVMTRQLAAARGSSAGWRRSPRPRMERDGAARCVCSSGVFVAVCDENAVACRTGPSYFTCCCLFSSAPSTCNLSLGFLSRQQSRGLFFSQMARFIVAASSQMALLSPRACCGISFHRP